MSSHYFLSSSAVHPIFVPLGPARGGAGDDALPLVVSENAPTDEVGAPPPGGEGKTPVVGCESLG